MSAPRDNCQCRIIPVARTSGRVPPFPYSIKRDAVTVEYCPMHAAAPRLLEACKLALGELQVSESDYQEGLADFLREVIAEATLNPHRAEAT